MTFDMHHADEMNPVLFDEVKDFVRELANQCPSYVAVYDGVPKGILFNLLLNKCKLFKELKAKASLPLFIPVKSLGHVSLSLRPNDYRKAHFLREVMRA